MIQTHTYDVISISASEYAATTSERDTHYAVVIE